MLKLMMWPYMYVADWVELFAEAAAEDADEVIEEFERKLRAAWGE